MYKIIIIILLIFNNCLLLKAQNLTNTRIAGNNVSFLSDGFWLSKVDSQRKIEGTPYLFNNWLQNGKIYFADKVYIIKGLNYNIQSERFEAKITEDSIFALNHGSFNKVEINGKIYTRHLDPDFKRNTYFENVIHFKNKYILKKYIIKVKEGQINPMTMTKIQQDKYIKNEQFYLLEDNNIEIVKIKLKKSLILSLIEDSKKAKIKEYAKKHRLGFNRNDDVLKILFYYNSI